MRPMTWRFILLPLLNLIIHVIFLNGFYEINEEILLLNVIIGRVYIEFILYCE